MSAASTWVGERLGVRLSSEHDTGLRVEHLAGVAVRRNPRRAHLLVSTVLGKHIPTDPRIVYGAGLLLGARVRACLTGERPSAEAEEHLAGLLDDPSDADAIASFATQAEAGIGPQMSEAPLVIGYAETAVALGHAVADGLPGSHYLHSTRRLTPIRPVGGFEEEHSHATGHLLCPAAPDLLVGPVAARRPLVLVDDELTTGRTVLNTIAVLHRLAPRPRYVVAALLDLRSAPDEAAMAEVAGRLGVPIDVVSLARGQADLPPTLTSDAARLVAALPESATTPATARAAPLVPTPRGTLLRARPAGVPEGGRHGISQQQRRALAQWLAATGEPLAPIEGERVLVLGTEELMAAPLLLAKTWAEAEPAAIVKFSTTTRSPAIAVDDPGYPLRTALRFETAEPVEDDTVTRFAYNVAPAGGEPLWDRIVLVHDDASAEEKLTAPGGLLDHLARCARRVDRFQVPIHHGRRLPPVLRGPAFGSYAPDEVGWLLTDLSHVGLEAPTLHREREIQSGRAHYAESLPIEFQPDAAYTALFHQAVAESARRLAYDVGMVAELVRAERSERPVLVSLARAGVPVGILLRRWFQRVHAVAPDHYAVSIVRGRGIDALALRYLQEHHDRQDDVVFVDGWTGKGAITRELGAAITRHNDLTGTRFNPDMVVLADPGRCVRTFGTRDDFLIPSACLNSTVSGLVSRTVLNDRLIGPGDFHGAKFYADLAPADVSNEFLDAVSSRFAEVADDVARDWPVLAATDREPDWAGWAAVEQISERYGIGQVNLVKPGVGETTRVLLRRVPERVLVRPGAEGVLRHVLVLAAQRKVPVEVVDDLPYSCVGLIRPQDGGEG